VKFSVPHESITGTEYPVVADVDGDFYTELVVTHEGGRSECPREDPLMEEVVREPGRHYQGITVYRDHQDRWAPSRPLWSQHAEHWSDRNDDGTVPPVEEPSWETHNSYRQALPAEGGTALDIPDLTVRLDDEILPECSEIADDWSQQMTAEVCNRGLLPVAPGALVSFRVSEGEGEACQVEPVCSAETTVVLEPGQCEAVQCEWADFDIPLDTEYFVCAAVDEDGEVNECHDGNNAALMNDTCPRPLI
jgi:hypothetical protein